LSLYILATINYLHVFYSLLFFSSPITSSHFLSTYYLFLNHFSLFSSSSSCHWLN
jgi:hypothetical protein